MIPLRQIAHSRTGDKGNISNISLIAYESSDFPLIEKVTAEQVLEHFRWTGVTKVDRYCLPQLKAINFVLHGALGGGVTRSLALDAHGKCLSSYLLEMHV